ncbi:hypothetical protein ACHAW6_007807 [Cyclotella cf. meneghiniana]
MSGDRRCCLVELVSLPNYSLDRSCLRNICSFVLDFVSLQGISFHIHVAILK